MLVGRLVSWPGPSRRSVCQSVLAFFSPFYVISSHFKSFYTWTFCLLVLTTARDLLALVFFHVTVEPRSNRPATNGIPPITNANSQSLQLVSFHFLLLNILIFQFYDLHLSCICRAFLNGGSGGAGAGGGCVGDRCSRSWQTSKG